MRTLKTLVCGMSGSGKTYYGLTHPKLAYIGTEPNGLDTAESCPELKANIVMNEEFIPSPLEDIKDVFVRLDKYVIECHKAGKEGKVESLFLDNMTFLADNRWLYIEKYEKQFGKSGEVNTMAMYGALAKWLYNFTLISLLSFPGNVIVSCHEKLEGDDAMDRKTDKTTPIVPNILGGFRDEAPGLFSAVLFLEKKKTGDGYKYFARCQKGGQRNGKNRYGLPEIVENISYQSIIDALPKESVVNEVIKQEVLTKEVVK